MDKPYTFKDRSEVMSLEGVQDSPGVGPKNFSALLGDYHFSDDTLPLKCCCLKPGDRLCAQDHRNGYVVELTDGRKSLLGSTCVNEFGDDGNLNRLIRHHNNQKRYEERIAFINHCFHSKSRMLQELRGKYASLDEISKYYVSIKGSLPKSAMRKLEGMAKQGDGKVVVELVSIKEEVDKETGRVEQERYVTPHTVGQIPGLKLFYSEAWSKLRDELEDMIKLIDELDYMHRGKVGAIKVARLHKKLEAAPTLCSATDQYAAEKFSFESFDKKPLCFLVTNSKEREILARMWWMESTKQPLSPASAKAKLRDMDDEYKRRFRAQELRIP